MAEEKNIKIILEERDSLAAQERKLYLETVEKINMQTRELLDNNFGTMLVQNIGRDLAGEVVRRYFDLGDYYITVDQLYDRFVHFSYDNDTDIFHTDEGIRKVYYNYTDGINSKTLKNISDTCRDAQRLVLCQEKVQVKSELFLQPSIFYPANLSILFNFCSYTFSYSFGDRYPQ